MSEAIDRALSKAAEAAFSFTENTKGSAVDDASGMARIRTAKELILIRGEIAALRTAIQELTEVQKLRS